VVKLDLLEIGDGVNVKEKLFIMVIAGSIIKLRRMTLMKLALQAHNTQRDEMVRGVTSAGRYSSH
jgi:hypothetical protein